MNNPTTPLHPVATTQAGEFELFKAWAEEWLGQGYSLDMEDHVYTDPVTRWAFKGFKAGLRTANQAADAVPVALTDDQINDVAINYAVHVAADIYDIRRYDCAEDFYNCVRKCVEIAHPSPTTAPAATTPAASESIANDDELAKAWFAANNKYIVVADFDAWLEQAYRDGLRDARAHTAAQVAATTESLLTTAAIQSGIDVCQARIPLLEKIEELAAQVVASKPAAASGEALYAAAITALTTLQGYCASVIDEHKRDGYPGELGLRPQDVAPMWAEELRDSDVRAYLDEAIADAKLTPPSQAPALPATGEALTDALSGLTRYDGGIVDHEYGVVGLVPKNVGRAVLLSDVIAALKGGA